MKLRPFMRICMHHVRITLYIDNTPTLSQEESDSLEGPITLQEALSSIKQMKNDRSPGSDGFTAELKKKKSFSQTWVHLSCALLTMSSTVAKCQSHKDKGLLFVYPRKENIKKIEKLETHHSAEYCVQNCIFMYCC